MKPFLASVLLALASVQSASAEDAPLRVFIRAGEKTHGPGAHDHPRFLEDWRKLLNERGASADGALKFPTAEQIEGTDVIMFYAANAGNVDPEQRKLLEAFRSRGGGLVFIHDAVCGDDAHWFKGLTGGAWEHGRSKWFEGSFGVQFTNHDHPVTRGAADFRLDDEIYWNLHMAPGAMVLATTDSEKAPESPQLWTFEDGHSRTFTAIPGHWHSTFSLPHYKAILLRGIAWAGKRQVDLLTTPEEVAAMASPVEAAAVKQDP